MKTKKDRGSSLATTIVMAFILLVFVVGIIGPEVTGQDKKKADVKKADTTMTKREQKAKSEIEKKLKDTIDYRDIRMQQKVLDSLLRKKK